MVTDCVEKQTKTKHVVLFSGGHSSALAAIYCVDKFGKENVILLNHDINPKYEHEDIKRFKREVSEYLGLPITYANMGDLNNPDNIPSQFQVCIDADTITNPSTGDAICTSRLKTEPFWKYLWINFLPHDTLFEARKDVVLYYGFDETEQDRIIRRSSILGAKGYKTDYPIALRELRITDTNQIGIYPPSTYSIFKHANCIGCLKAGLLHWYVVYVLYPKIYQEAIEMEDSIGDYTIHRVTRDKVTTSISLRELATIYEQIKTSGVPATEHQSAGKFGLLLRKFQIEQCNVNKPCECTE